jgi:mycothiol system anti-sigma-R factor
MSCDFTGAVLHGYLDGELDAVRAAEFERHLERCSECVSAMETQEFLRSSIERAQLYEQAPASLRAKVLSEVGASPSIKLMSRRALWSLLAAAAALLLVVYGGWRVLDGLRGGNNQAILAAQILDAHLRSLQPGHLTDVVSSDQHTVKPWFDGRLDFSPPVRDFADQGVPLLGGRLDVIRSRTVAALVYGRRKHVINVFIWPSSERESQLISGTKLGYNWVHWGKDGMEISAVSDVNSADLFELHQLLVQ